MVLRKAKWISGFCLAAAFGLSGIAQAACVDRGFSETEKKVMDAYIAYYGRPADAAGLAWWAGELDKAGGDLSAIIDSFGNSQEFTERYGAMSSQDLINNLYQQIFGRSADQAGLDWYTGQLDSGAESLQKITLAILGGVQGDDVNIVDNRRTTARHFVTEMEVNDGLSIADELYNSLLTTVASDSSTAEAACTLLDTTILGMGGALYNSDNSDDNGGDSGTGSPQESGIISQGSGSCQTVVWPAVGASMDVVATTYVDGQDPTSIEMSLTITSSSGDVLGVKTVQSGAVEGISYSNESDTLTTYNIHDGAYWLLGAETTSVSESMGFTSSSQSTTSYAVEEYGAPQTACQGMKWYSGSVSFTTTTTTTSSGITLPPQTVTAESLATTSEVLSMSESVTVPAGTFNTIKIKMTDDDGAYTINWLINGNWWVKQESYDKTGKLVSKIEATRVTL